MSYNQAYYSWKQTSLVGNNQASKRDHVLIFKRGLEGHWINNTHVYMLKL